MMPIQYMLPNGAWLESCQDDTPPRDPAAIPAPADASGFHGADGLQWTGTAWVAYKSPPDSCTRFQGLRALGRIRVQQIEATMEALDTLELYPGFKLSEDEVWSIRTAWKEAGTFERLSPDLTFVMWLFGWDDDLRDNFFRWVDSGNTGVFPG